MSLADVDSETIRVWNLETGALQTFAFDGGGSVNGVAFSPSGDRIAVAAGGALHLTGPTQSFDVGGGVSSTEWIRRADRAVDGDIVLLDVSSGATEEIHSGVFDPPRGCAVRREGCALRSSPGINVLALATRASTVVMARASSPGPPTRRSSSRVSRGAGPTSRSTSAVPGTEGTLTSLVSPSELTLSRRRRGDPGSEVAVLGPLPVQAFDVEPRGGRGLRALVVDRGRAARSSSRSRRFEGFRSACF
jgi:hypothetical protein